MKTKINDFIFDIIVYVAVTFAGIITLYPFLYVFSMSISDPVAVAANKVFLLPVGFSFESYKKVVTDSRFLISYYNTIWYVVVGTTLNVIFTVMCAYPLSKKRFFARNFFMLVIVITMFFSGGLIPFYLLVLKLGLYNSRWAMVLPGLIGSMSVVMCRTYFQELPEELFESARIDGASEFRIIYRILIPISTPIIAVLALFYAVGHWNSWFNALLFLKDSSLHPIQIFLRRILIESSPELMDMVTISKTELLSMLQVKYTAIIVASLPIIVIYPFLQKYFVKGIMLGSLKG